MGKCSILLTRLSQSTEIGKRINSLRVKILKNKMLSQMDPALLTLTVYPSEPENFNSKDLQSNHYTVLHGQHRLAALKELKEEGKLKDLPGMNPGRAAQNIFCFVVGTQGPILVSQNFSIAQFMGTPRPSPIFLILTWNLKIQSLLLY